MFPASIDGEFKLACLEEEEVDPLLKQLERSVLARRRVLVVRKERGIEMRTRLERDTSISAWSPIAMLEHARIELRPGRPATVAYRFSCGRALAYSLLMAALLVAGGVYVFGVTPVALLPAVIGWSWFFGVSYGIKRRRLPQFLKKLVLSARSSSVRQARSG